MIAHLALSMISRPGTPPNHSRARRWQPSQVVTLWSQTNSTYWCRLKHSVITNAQVRRRTTVGVDHHRAGAEIHLRRLARREVQTHRGLSGARSARIAATMRATDE